MSDQSPPVVAILRSNEYEIASFKKSSHIFPSIGPKAPW